MLFAPAYYALARPKLPPAPPTTLGQRLKELRTTLGFLDGAPWSRAYVAQAAQVSVGAIARLERASSGTAASLAALARFYQRQGFNLQWLFAPDNKDESPYTFDGRWDDADRLRAFEELGSLRKYAQEPVVQERITMIQEQLLPAPSYYHRTKADLWRYQYYLPPVAASSNGWRPRAFNIPPHHYYKAGESLPKCGAPFEYLIYDSMPERPSRSTTCSQCADLLPLDLH